MASAFLVSYVRAKSEGLGFTAGTGMAAIGLMPREVRLVVLTLGLVLAGAAGGVSSALDAGGSLWLAAALAIIAVGATITVIQRVLHVRGQAVAEARERPT
jgi:uncharacterized membrane protein